MNPETQREIEAHVKKAREAYPGLVVNSLTQLSIQFASGGMCTITIPPNFSLAPPRVDGQWGPVDLVITSHWSSTFQLVDVLRELEIAMSCRQPAPLQVPPGIDVQLQRAPVQQIMTPEGRWRLICESVPFMKDLDTRLKSTKALIAESKAKIAENMKKTDRDCAALSDLLMQVNAARAKVASAKNGTPKMKVESMKRKENQLNARVRELQGQVDKLQGEFESGSVKVNEFCKRMMELKEEQNYAKMLAGVIAQQRQELEVTL